MIIFYEKERVVHPVNIYISLLMILLQSESGRVIYHYWSSKKDLQSQQYSSLHFHWSGAKMYVIPKAIFFRSSTEDKLWAPMTHLTIASQTSHTDKADRLNPDQSWETHQTLKAVYAQLRAVADRIGRFV